MQNELVKSRLRQEETEAELVRYKLLYAEAMQQSAEAASRSHGRTVSDNGGLFPPQPPRRAPPMKAPPNKGGAPNMKTFLLGSVLGSQGKSS